MGGVEGEEEKGKWCNLLIDMMARALNRLDKVC